MSVADFQACLKCRYLYSNFVDFFVFHNQLVHKYITVDQILNINFIVYHLNNKQIIIGLAKFHWSPPVGVHYRLWSCIFGVNVWDVSTKCIDCGLTHVPVAMTVISRLDIWCFT